MRTNIEIDDELVAAAMRRYGVSTKREIVDLALRRLMPEPMDREAMRGLRGRGWGVDLDELRAPHEPDEPA